MNKTKKILLAALSMGVLLTGAPLAFGDITDEIDAIYDAAAAHIEGCTCEHAALVARIDDFEAELKKIKEECPDAEIAWIKDLELAESFVELCKSSCNLEAAVKSSKDKIAQAMSCKHTLSGGTSNGGNSNGGNSNGGTSNGGNSNGGTSNGGNSNDENGIFAGIDAFLHPYFVMHEKYPTLTGLIAASIAAYAYQTPIFNIPNGFGGDMQMIDTRPETLARKRMILCSVLIPGIINAIPATLKSISNNAYNVGVEISNAYSNYSPSIYNAAYNAGVGISNAYSNYWSSSNTTAP